MIFDTSTIIIVFVLFYSCYSGFKGELCNEYHRQLTGGEIAAIVICTLIFIAALIALGFWYIRWRRSHAPKKDSGWGKRQTDGQLPNWDTKSDDENIGTSISMIRINYVQQ